MIQGIQKIIKIGSSWGVTIPAKELKRQNIKFGDDVEIIVRPLNNTNSEDREIVETAKQILQKYKKDFQNLAQR